jgi:two-component system, NtrC family, response regulator AtoC
MHRTNRELILVAEDEPEVRNYLELSLRCHGYDVEKAENGDEALMVLKGGRSGVSLVLLDVMMPFKDGIETLREIRRFDKNLPVIMLSGGSEPCTIVETMKCGADDYLTKPASQVQLLGAIEKTLAKHDAVHFSSLKELPKNKDIKDIGAAGPTSWMRRMEKVLRQVAVSEASVLIQGETGSGKEVVARTMHNASPRAGHPFLKVNCAALPSELVESELFGYERGAFTGAIKSKLGKFDMADEGTIFLDEIGDMDFRLQAKLLQVLQDQEFQRLGGKETIRVNVRVMAATHCDLESAIREGRFREDLYYRLNVINIQVPPLRDRPEEIEHLARHFLQKYAVPGSPTVEIPAALSEALIAYPWPGNVRELENVMRRCLALHDPLTVAADLRLRSQRKSESIRPISSKSQLGSLSTPVPMPTLKKVNEVQRQTEIDAIMTVLHGTRWNRKQAAALLNMDYKALLYKMKKLGVDRKASDLEPVEN